jgi:Zn-dependent protease with chaperone function
MAANGSSSPDYSILAAFNTPITRPKTGVFYHVCLLLVTVAMLVLPLVYVAFVGAIAWATYYHAAYDWSPIMNFGGISNGRIIIVKFLIYAVPLFAGIVVVFFMVKPLLAGRPKHAQPLALNPSDNPLLYAFIAKICDAVGAPAPRRIDMDCDLNASASFRRGFRSLAGNDLVLTIGLPLVANFSARDLAGVIAHEFGHFTQGAGMRLSYIIRSINFWFARVAYERDAWDVALQQWADEIEDGRAALIVWSIQIAVWFSRLVLKILMFTGHIVAGFMLRQMEYDADAYQIKIVGSEAFEVTHRKLATLSAAMDATYRQIHARWKKSGQLPDNLSELLRQMHENLPADVLQKIDDHIGFHRTGLFDSHPSPADRIRRARKAGERGVFDDDRPATALFASFEHPARFVTLLHYTDDLGIPVNNQMLLHVESTQPKAAQGYAASRKPAEEFFLGMLPMLLPLQIQMPAPSANFEADSAELNQLSSGLQQVAGQLAPIAAQYAGASQKLLKAHAALRLLNAGVTIEPQAFGLASATIEAAQSAETNASAASADLQHSVHEVTAALKRRLELALALKLAENGEVNSGSLERIKELVERLNQAAADYTWHEEAMNSLAVLDNLNGVRSSLGETPALSRALESQAEIVNAFIAAPEPTAQIVAKPGLQLQISKQPSYAHPSEIESLRLKTRQWLGDYARIVDELADIVKF